MCVGGGWWWREGGGWGGMGASGIICNIIRRYSTMKEEDNREEEPGKLRQRGARKGGRGEAWRGGVGVGGAHDSRCVASVFLFFPFRLLFFSFFFFFGIRLCSIQVLIK